MVAMAYSGRQMTPPEVAADGPALDHCDCPLCGADGADPSRYGQGAFRVARCRQCGLWYLSPRLSEAEMAEFYRRGDYFSPRSGTSAMPAASAMSVASSGYDDYGRQERSLRATFRAVLKRMDLHGLTGGSLLEIGCGYGYFLREAEPFFDTRAGAEMSADAAGRAAPHVDDIFVGGVEAVPADRKFDCIVALHVIEHVYHPREFLARVAGHLKDGGALLLAAPDMGGFWRKLMGNKWPSFKIPEHVAFYEAATLSRLMRDAGFRDIVDIDYRHAFPLDQVFGKLGLPAFPWLSSTNVWLPATTVAVAGRRGAGPGAAQ
jgi:SAM-dependent methyltransferase